MTARSHIAPVVKEVLLDAPVNKVWQAITDKRKMKEWYFDIPDFKAEVGFEFTFVGQDQDCVDYVHLCTITEVIPNKKLVHSWRYKGYEGNTFVSWELIAEGDKTRLILTHSGLDTLPAGIKAFDSNNFNMGWTELIQKRLPAFLNNNSSVS